MSDTKDCFVVSPIGSEGSETRERADKLLQFIIREALDEYDYEVKRADEMSEPGSITTQVIENVVESDLVIADLTNHNPNVFYELAIRHATGKPYIQLIESSQNIPFDIADLRTIDYNFDVSVAARTVTEIKNQVDKIEGKDTEFDSPISRTAELKSWKESDDPENRNFADLASFMQKLAGRMDSIERKLDQEKSQRGMNIDELIRSSGDLKGRIDLDDEVIQKAIVNPDEDEVEQIRLVGGKPDNKENED